MPGTSVRLAQKLSDISEVSDNVNVEGAVVRHVGGIKQGASQEDIHFFENSTEPTTGSYRMTAHRSMINDTFDPTRGDQIGNWGYNQYHGQVDVAGINALFWQFEGRYIRGDGVELAEAHLERFDDDGNQNRPITLSFDEAKSGIVPEQGLGISVDQLYFISPVTARKFLDVRTDTTPPSWNQYTPVGGADFPYATWVQTTGQIGRLDLQAPTGQAAGATLRLSSDGGVNVAIFGIDGAGTAVFNATGQTALSFTSNMWFYGPAAMLIYSDVYAWGRFTVGTTGQFIDHMFSAVATLDFPSVAAGNKQDLTVTITGVVAAAQPTVIVTPPVGSITNGVTLIGYASADNTITVRASNNDQAVAHDPPSGDYRISVIQFQ